jgi:acylphosphatase
MIAKRIIFTGRVQGVGFRYTAHSIASSRRVTGYVRNLPDGDVEMLVQGDVNDIEDCLNQIKEAFEDCIRDIQTEDVKQDSRHKDFRITF